MNNDLKNRKGVLRIEGELIFQSQLVFAEIIVVRCEHDFMSNSFIYNALSPHFKVVEPGMMYPEYEAIVHEVHDDPTATWVEFVEVK